MTAKQRKGEPRRRWFYSRELELIVWLDKEESMVGFQLAYDKDAVAHALTWKAPDQFDHAAIDTGETHPLKHKATPILVEDGLFEPSRLAERFRRVNADVPKEYADVVLAKIREFGETR